MSYTVVTLVIILLLILILPLVSKRVEENIELFLFSMSVLAGLVTQKILDINVVRLALREPIFVHGVPFGIFQAVLVFGIVSYYLRYRLRKLIKKIIRKFGPAKTLGILTLVLSMLSSIISVIVASILLSEIALASGIERRRLSRYLVYSAFSLGAGAILTPIGEPLATIVNSKLSVSPHYPGPIFLIETFGPYIIAMVIAFSIVAALQLRDTELSSIVEESVEEETLRDVILRALKVYVFVLALVILGESFSILVEMYFSKISADLYYLLGSISSFVDNATLAAAMVGPELTKAELTHFILSMLISGGFLVPGNIPNIIIASRTGINFREWASYALRVGIPAYILMYLILRVVGA